MSQIEFPGQWPQALKDFGQGLFEYGRVCDEAMIPPLIEQYKPVVVATTDEQRMDLMLVVIDLAERQYLSGNGLYPFLFVDPSDRILSTAALHYVAVHAGMTEADLLAGVRFIADYAWQFARAGDVPRAAGFLRAMVQIGDRRIIEHLGACWRWLPPEGRPLLTQLDVSIPEAAVIEWLMNWLEECEGDEFGAVAGTLGRAGRMAEAAGVVEVRRALPI